MIHPRRIVLHDVERMRTKVVEGQKHFENNRRDKAILAFEDALRYEMPPIVEMYVCERLALLYKATGSLKWASAFLERQVGLARNGDSEFGLFDALNNYGVALYEQGDGKGALVALEEAQAIALRLQDYKRQARVIGNLGNVMALKRSFSKALALHEQQKRMCVRAGLPLEPALANLKTDYILLHKDGEAAALGPTFEKTNDHCTGWLWKHKNEQLHPKRRGRKWCVLSKKHLHFHNMPGKGQHYVDLGLIESVKQYVSVYRSPPGVAPRKGAAESIVIHIREKQPLIFQAETQEEAQSWITELNRAWSARSQFTMRATFVGRTLKGSGPMDAAPPRDSLASQINGMPEDHEMQNPLFHDDDADLSMIEDEAPNPYGAVTFHSAASADTPGPGFVFGSQIPHQQEVPEEHDMRDFNERGQMIMSPLTSSSQLELIDVDHVAETEVDEVAARMYVFEGHTLDESDVDIGPSTRSKHNSTSIVLQPVRDTGTSSILASNPGPDVSATARSASPQQELSLSHWIHSPMPKGQIESILSDHDNKSGLLLASFKSDADKTTLVLSLPYRGKATHHLVQHTSDGIRVNGVLKPGVGSFAELVYSFQVQSADWPAALTAYIATTGELVSLKSAFQGQEPRSTEPERAGDGQVVTEGQHLPEHAMPSIGTPASGASSVQTQDGLKTGVQTERGYRSPHSESQSGGDIAEGESVHKLSQTQEQPQRRGSVDTAAEQESGRFEPESSTGHGQLQVQPAVHTQDKEQQQRKPETMAEEELQAMRASGSAPNPQGRLVADHDLSQLATEALQMLRQLAQE
eukprot:m.8386 g.8386  ORF g.8386 m.8386 type:complete len:808 (+) comp5351_c0_seq2:109-2532(+)